MKKTLLITALCMYAFISNAQTPATMAWKDRLTRVVLGDAKQIAEDMNNKEKDEYVHRTKREVALNYVMIKELRDKLAMESGINAEQHKKEINGLEAKNEGLRAELTKYINKGKGNVNVFRSDFDKNLEPLAQGIMSLQYKVNSEDPAKQDNRQFAYNQE